MSGALFSAANAQNPQSPLKPRSTWSANGCRSAPHKPQLACDAPALRSRLALSHLPRTACTVPPRPLLFHTKRAPRLRLNRSCDAPRPSCYVRRHLRRRNFQLLAADFSLPACAPVPGVLASESCVSSRNSAPAPGVLNLRRPLES